MSCTAQSHAIMRASVALFETCTTNRREGHGLLMGECRACDSTLALDVCFLCSKPCPSTDALEWNPDGAVAHFGCIARIQGAKASTRFVIVAGKGEAREFVRSGS